MFPVARCQEKRIVVGFVLFRKAAYDQNHILISKKASLQLSAGEFEILAPKLLTARNVNAKVNAHNVFHGN